MPEEFVKIIIQNDPKIDIKQDPGHSGQRVISCKTKDCRISRLIDGKPCTCTVVWALDNGNCPCAPSDSSNSIVLVSI